MDLIWPRYTDKRYVNVLRELRLRIVLTRAALFLETLSRRFWPAWTLAMFAYAFVAFGGLTQLPQVWTPVVVVTVIIVELALLGLGTRKLKIPTREAAIDRLDRSVVGAPLSSLRDHPIDSKDDYLTLDLWDKHQSRMADHALTIQFQPPDLRLSVYDRWGLRLMALTCAITAFVFSPVENLNISNGVDSLLGLPDPIATSVEGWATPPAYTGKPQIYLGDVPDGEILELPIGTEIVMQVYGGAEEIVLTDGVSKAGGAFSGAETTGLNARFTVEQSGIVEVFDGAALLENWKITVIADLLPSIMTSQEVRQAPSGTMELPFTAEDDYGIVGGSAVITLNLDQVERKYGLIPDPSPRQPLTANLPMPFRGDKASVSEMLVEDFSKDIWVGLPVNIALQVRDAAGQTGITEVSAVLPGKKFYIPIAAALAEQRRDLLWSQTNDYRVLQVLLALTYLPEDLALSSAIYLKLRAAIRRLESASVDGLSDEERAEIAEALWQVAVFIEDGELGDARERLKRAQEKLLQAIEQNAERDEIANLMEELRDATDKYMEMLSAEAKEVENRETSSANLGQSGNDQLRRMLDELQQLAENGEKESARRLLEAMRQLIEDLQLAEQSGSGNTEQIEQMQDALGQQQELSDQTYRELQDQLNGGDQAPPQNQQQLADQQEILREFLESLLDQQSSSASEPTDKANENMGDARDHLQDGELGKALNEQAQAIENLRESIRRLGEEAQQAGQGRDGLQAGETENSRSQNDPLGRPLGRRGTTEFGDALLPEQSTSDRARELLDEIRRRSGDTDRPEIELEYLKRLLDLF